MVANEILILSCIAVFGIGFLCGYVINDLGRKEEKKMQKENAEHCVCCGRVIPEGRQVCVICRIKARNKKTNYNRIRNMSVDELANLFKQCDCGIPPYCSGKYGKCENDCFECAKQWLESEVATE